MLKPIRLGSDIGTVNDTLGSSFQLLTLPWLHGCMGAWVHGALVNGALVNGCIGEWVHGHVLGLDFGVIHEIREY